MTTYLATTTTIEFEETITLPFCSSICRELSSYRDGWTGRYATIESYEFHERCHYCDSLVLASWIIQAAPSFDLESIRIAARAVTKPSSTTWQRIRESASHEFTRPN